MKKVLTYSRQVVSIDGKLRVFRGWEGGGVEVWSWMGMGIFGLAEQWYGAALRRGSSSSSSSSKRCRYH